jgi:hypothetical protein
MMKMMKIVSIVCLMALLCVSVLASCDVSTGTGIGIQHPDNNGGDNTKPYHVPSAPSEYDEETDEETGEETDPDNGNEDPATTQGVVGDEPVDGGDGTVVIEGTDGLIYGYTDDDSAFWLVDASNCQASTVVVANQYMGLPVVGIAPDAFYGCEWVESVVLHEGIEYIGERAFWGCVNLQSVELPFAVKAIGPNAFYGCSSLSYVSFGDLDGWYCAYNYGDSEGIEMDVTDPMTNASNLKDEGYYGLQWWMNR